MKITILTLFPKMFEGFLSESIIGRAQKKKLISIDIVDLRKWGTGKHKSVDDTPYGGGAGMVMKVDVVSKAIKDVINNYQLTISKQISNKKSQKRPTANSKQPIAILLTPQGKTFTQSKANKLAIDRRDIILVCGHYEGFDERIRDYVDEEISIGDYVLTGGELAAAVVTDAVIRLMPGVLGNNESSDSESFSDLSWNLDPGARNLLEFPQYTRPEEFEGKKVPEILKSGNHAKIAIWRKNEARKRTKKRRPDLLK